MGSRRASLGLTVLAVPDLDPPSNLAGSLITREGSHQNRLLVGRASKALHRVLGVSSRRRCGAASGTGWDGVGVEVGGGGRRTKRESPPNTPLHTQRPR